MSNVELQIDELAPVCSGGVVSGLVTVTLAHPCAIELWVGPHLTARSGHNVEISAYDQGVTVHRGPLDAGCHRMAFEFVAPAEPASFDGETMSVRWRLEAVAATDSERSSATTPLVIEPPRDTGMTVSTFGKGSGSDIEASGPGCTIASLVITVALLAGAAGGWAADLPDVWMTLVIFGVLSALLSFGMFRLYRAGKMLGTPELEIDPLFVSPAQASHLPVRLTHRPGAPVAGADVTLSVLEYRRHDASRPFQERVISSRTQPLQQSGDGEWTGSMQLPEPGALPYAYMTNGRVQIRWVLRARLSGDRVPDQAAHATLWLDATPGRPSDGDTSL